MNILPKKSWHVRTRANIEKVRSDEKKAAIRENDRLERIATAEREARTAFLRQQTGVRPTAESANATVASATATGRFNIFDDVDRGKGDIRRNKEREKEEKDRTEDWEQRVGILTFLHKKESSDGLWYLQAPQLRKVAGDQMTDERRKERIEAQDPLLAMKRYGDQLRQHSDTEKSKGKEEKTTKWPKHQLKRGEVSSLNKRDQMREERMRRERKERQRATRLLAVTETPVSVRHVDDERDLHFNSQFNPHLSRR